MGLEPAGSVHPSSKLALALAQGSKMSTSSLALLAAGGVSRQRKPCCPWGSCPSAASCRRGSG